MQLAQPPAILVFVYNWLSRMCAESLMRSRQVQSVSWAQSDIVKFKKKELFLQQISYMLSFLFDFKTN